LRKQAAGLIVARLDAMTVSEAAKQLGVSRQAIYDFKKGDYCPSLALIQRACEVWDLEFTFRGLQVGKKTLQPKTHAKRPPEQLDLFGSLQLLQSRQFEVVRAKRMGRAFELVLRVQLQA
jgi:DNA-binding XRE family transcriptional regulator